MIADDLFDEKSDFELEEIERAQMMKMLNARADRDGVLMGSSLNSSALNYFDENKTVLRRMISGTESW